MTQEALKLALEALEDACGECCNAEYKPCFQRKAITAIKKALSGCQCPECQVVLHASDCAVHNEPAYSKGACNCGAQPEQEPVAWISHAMTSAEKAIDVAIKLEREACANEAERTFYSVQAAENIRARGQK